MNKSIIYDNTDNDIKIRRTDLIDIIRVCEFEETLSPSMREEYEKVICRTEEFSDYSIVVRILKPESKMSVSRYCEIYSGIVLVSGKRDIFQYYRVNSEKVIFYVPSYMLNSIIRRIIGCPKVITISTSSVSNTNHWLDPYIREKFKEADMSLKKMGMSISSAFKQTKHDDCFDAFRYCMNDVWATQEFYEQLEETMRPRLRIKNVIFNDPATIVFWYDGTKTVVKCQPGDTFDPEKGLAMAICKKVLGYNKSQSNFNDIFKKWLPKEEEKKEPTVIGKILDMITTDKGLVMKGEITDPKFTPSINESLGILGE